MSAAGPGDGHEGTGTERAGFPPEPTALDSLFPELPPDEEPGDTTLTVIRHCDLAALTSRLAEETARREAAEAALAALPALEHRIGVSALTGEPLGISPEAAAAMAEAGLVMVRADDLRVILGLPRRDPLRPDEAAAWNRLAPVAWAVADGPAEAGAGSGQGEQSPARRNALSAVCECGPGESCETCQEDT